MPSQDESVPLLPHPITNVPVASFAKARGYFLTAQNQYMQLARQHPERMQVYFALSKRCRDAVQVMVVMDSRMKWNEGLGTEQREFEYEMYDDDMESVVGSLMTDLREEGEKQGL